MTTWEDPQAKVNAGYDKVFGHPSTQRPKPHPDEALWKNRFERLAQFMDDAKFDIQSEGFDRCNDRAWDPPETICVSFAFDVVSDEEKAIELYGADNYDVYTLTRRSPKT